MQVHASQFREGKPSDDNRIRHLLRMVDDLKKRVDALEAKRGPGRPRNEDKAA